MGALGVVAVVGLYGFVVAYTYGVVGRRRGPALPAVMAALAIGFVLPPDWAYARIVAVVLGVAMAAKVFEFSRRPASDPRMTASPHRFLFWLTFPPDSRAPTTADEARANRGRGLRRTLRGATKGAVVYGLLLLAEHYPQLHDAWWMQMQWALWLTYCATSGLTDIGTGLAMQTGFHLDENFKSPPLASSPGDFWSRRWNLFIHRFALRNVFMPLGGRRRPLVATAAIFLASGVMHEYLIVAALGRPGSHTGWMLAFFALHGAAVIIEAATRRIRRGVRVPRGLAIAIHLGWLTATAPLFFEPLAEVFPG